VTRTLEELLAGRSDGPAVDVAALAARVRDSRRVLLVLDDDPTGSQTVHDVAVVTVFDPDEVAAGLDGPGGTCFILTNTRSMG